MLDWLATPRGVALLGLIVALIALGTWLLPRGSATPDAGTPPQKLIKVRVAVNPVPLGALAIVAAEGDHWKHAGLDVQLVAFPSGKASLDAVLAGGAEFGTAAETPIMRAGLAGLAPVVLATIASSPDDCKVVYRKDHGISRPADLKGKKVATAFGTSAEYFMDAFLKHHGILRSEVTAVSMRPAEMVDAFARGDISAFFIWEPYPLYAQRLVADGSGTFSGEKIYTETFQIVARQDYAEANPEISRRLLRGLIEAERHTVTQQQDAAAKVATFTQIKAEDVGAIWKNFRFRVELDSHFVSLLESEADWARAADATLSKNVNFHLLVSPQPLRDVDAARVSITP